MLVYEKKVDGERHIFGTLGNIPGEDDPQLTYKDSEGGAVEPTLEDSYFDDGHGGINMVNPEGGKTNLYVFIEDVNIIPGDYEPPVATEYSVTVTTDGNGTASATPTKGKKGTEVALSNTPNTGYIFNAWEVIAGGVTISNNKFTIGEVDVTINATFKVEPEPENPDGQ